MQFFFNFFFFFDLLLLSNFFKDNNVNKATWMLFLCYPSRKLILDSIIILSYCFYKYGFIFM